jgi:hypothetical protein
LDSHAIRGLRSIYEGTRVSSNYVLVRYNNCTARTNAGGYCTVRHEEQRRRLEGFAMHVVTGKALFRSVQGSIMTRDLEQVTWTPQHAQDQGV